MSTVPLSKSISSKLILDSNSFTQQSPTGQGLSNAIDIYFGAEETTADGELKLYADGVLEVLNNEYEYIVDVSVTVGRTSAQNVAEMYAWLEMATDGVNYSQPSDSNTLYLALDDATTVGRETATITVPRTTPIGTRMKFRFGRSEDGVDQGSILTHTPTGEFVSLNPVPSATIRVRRIIGE